MCRLPHHRRQGDRVTTHALPLLIHRCFSRCKQCAPGSILTNNTCTACPNGTVATRIRSQDPVPTLCQACPPNTISNDGISCYVPCKQTFGNDVPYDLSAMSTYVIGLALSDPIPASCFPPGSNSTARNCSRRRAVVTSTCSTRVSAARPRSLARKSR